MKNKKANVFIYIILLINVILVLWIIIFNNSYVLRNNLNFWANAKEAFFSLYNKWKIAIDSVRKYNSNWNWFVDWISCPQNISMSWATMSWSNLISNIIYDNWIIYCSWNYTWEEFRIYFTDNKSDFSKVMYKWNSIWMVRSILTILEVLTNSRMYNSVISSAWSNWHPVSNSMDWNVNTYFEWKSSTNQFVDYNFFPSISIWKIVLKKPINNPNSSYWNSWRITFYNSSWVEITYILLSNIIDKWELTFDMKYLWLENKVQTIKVTSDYWKMDISEFEVYEMISTWVEELWEWDSTFNDLDLTKINFDFIWIWWGDNIDDDYNSDNYRVTSIWDTYYPNWYQDDDVIPRKVIFWNINPGQIYDNIYWTNQKTNEFIDKNTNNNDILNIKAWDVTNAYMYLDLYNENSNLYDLKILEFDRNIYNSEFSLYPIKSLNWKDLTSDVWYIQYNDWKLSLSKEKTWNEFVFDFKNKDYWIFISNKSSNNLVYRLSAETNTWTWIYISPIDDSMLWEIQVLSNYIKIWWEKNFIWESFIVTESK